MNGWRSPLRPRRPRRRAAATPTASPAAPPSGPAGRLWILVGVILASFLLTTLLGGDDGESIAYDDFIQQAGEGQVASITFDNTNGKITGELDDGTEFTTTGPLEGGIPDADLAILRANDVEINYKTPTPNPLWSILLLRCSPIILLIGFFLWMQRRAQGQMGGIMSIGRSQGQDLLHRAPGHDLRRRRRLRRA